MPPRAAPKRPHIDPSRSQEAAFSLLNFDLVFGSIWLAFWLPKRLPLGTLFAPKIAPKNRKKFKCPKSPPKTTQFRPKTAQDRPKRLPVVNLPPLPRVDVAQGSS